MDKSWMDDEWWMGWWWMDGWIMDHGWMDGWILNEWWMINNGGCIMDGWWWMIDGWMDNEWWRDGRWMDQSWMTDRLDEWMDGCGNRMRKKILNSLSSTWQNLFGPSSHSQTNNPLCLFLLLLHLCPSLQAPPLPGRPQSVLFPLFTARLRAVEQSCVCADNQPCRALFAVKVLQSKSTPLQ